MHFHIGRKTCSEISRLHIAKDIQHIGNIYLVFHIFSHKFLDTRKAEFNLKLLNLAKNYETNRNHIIVSSGIARYKSSFAPTRLISIVSKPISIVVVVIVIVVVVLKS